MCGWLWVVLQYGALFHLLLCGSHAIETQKQDRAPRAVEIWPKRNNRAHSFDAECLRAGPTLHVLLW